MVVPITVRESYVRETGKSMKAEQLGDPRGLLTLNLVYAHDPPPLGVLSEIAWFRQL